MWKSIGKYKEQNKFASWLFSIAHNIAIDYLRKNKHEKMHFTDLEPAENAVCGSDYHTEVETEEILRMIEKEVNRLPVRQKEVFLLRQYSEMSFREIAGLTNQPINTVLSHMHYAVIRLKAVLKEKK